MGASPTDEGGSRVGYCRNSTLYMLTKSPDLSRDPPSRGLWPRDPVGFRAWCLGFRVQGLGFRV